MLPDPQTFALWTAGGERGDSQLWLSWAACSLHLPSGYCSDRTPLVAVGDALRSAGLTLAHTGRWSLFVTAMRQALVSWKGRQSLKNLPLVGDPESLETNPPAVGQGRYEPVGQPMPTRGNLH